MKPPKTVERILAEHLRGVGVREDWDSLSDATRGRLLWQNPALLLQREARRDLAVNPPSTG
jgi:hypothetical protein